MVAVEANQRLEAALAYAAVGWPVVPLHTPTDGVCDCAKKNACESPGKHPRTMHGLDDATTDEAKIRRWWGIWPHANVAIDLARSGLVDIAPDSVEWHAEFIARGLPATAHFASGGGEGHRHYLYARPDDCPTYRLTESGQYDILSAGYAVMPPSLHASGATYTGLGDVDLSPSDAPGWVVAVLHDKASKKVRASGASIDFSDSDSPPVVLHGDALERWYGRLYEVRADGVTVNRSNSLSFIAYALLDAGLAPAYLASTLAACDVRLGWDKFTHRKDAVERYRVIADKAVASQGSKRVRLNNAAGHQAAPQVREFIITNLATVVAEKVDWLWQHRIPLGKLTLLDGDPDLGKSLITLDLAARLSTGKVMPDLSHVFEGTAGTVLLSAEDGVADTIRPRLEVAGGDPRRIVALEGIVARKGTLPAMPSLEDLDAIEAAVRAVDAKLIIVDPIMAYLPVGVSAFKDQEVRRLLGPLIALISRLGVALICVRHLNKDTSKPSLYRGGGSIGFSGAARSVMLVGQDPDDETHTRRILARQKGNLGPAWKSLVYEMVAEFDADHPHIRWHKETSELRADDLLQTRSPETPEAAGQLSEAVDYLEQTLRDGDQAALDVIAEAQKLGISKRTLERAKPLVGVRSQRKTVGDKARWYWSLVKDADKDASNGSHGNVGDLGDVGDVDG